MLPPTIISKPHTTHIAAKIVNPSERPDDSLMIPRIYGANAPVPKPIIIITPEADEWYLAGTTSYNTT